jgi:hypothetical protein
MLVHMGELLDPMALALCCAVSREWRALFSCDQFWKTGCLQELPSLRLPHTWKQLPFESLR